ncbi:MAG: DUF4173 domain-containing protein [Flavobacteriales bacterium]|nr:DUF4173 domain-containing protein [Flavobacteriales bacterium]
MNDPYARTMALLKNLSTRTRNTIALVLVTICFDRLFWQAGPGLGLTLFVFIVMAVLLVRGERPPTRQAWFSLVLTGLAATLVSVHGTVVAIVASILGLLVTRALLLEPELRSPPYALAQALTNMAVGPFRLPATLGSYMTGDRGASKVWRWLRIVLIPLFVFAVYVHLYRVASPRFDTLTASMLDGLGSWVADRLSWLFTPHFLFVLLGLLVAGGLVVRSAPGLWAPHELQWPDRLERSGQGSPDRPGGGRMDALERERRRGVLLLFLVNALLALVNAIDVHWFWTGFDVPAGFSLKQFVHEGTWALVFSILLSMGILLHLFRGELNFHPKGRLLRTLALLWVVQNFVLGISVFLRNHHYIGFHGLAYKRIGVMVFLVLVLVGLVTLFRKIRHRLSLFHLVRVNSWAMFVMLVALGLVDWDRLIVRHNLHHDNPAEIDIDNYLAMSDRVLPLLYEDLDLVERQMRKHRMNAERWVDHLDPVEFRAALDDRRRAFLDRLEAGDVRSWTWGGARARRELQELGLAGR